MKIYKVESGKWRVDGYSQGKRIRKLFKTRQQAELVAKQRQFEHFQAEHGIKELTETQQAVAIRCFTMLPPDSEPNVLLDIVNDWLVRQRVSNTCGFEKAIELYLKDLHKRNRRPRYIKSLEKTLNQFMRFFGSGSETKPVSEFHKAIVVDFLDNGIKQTPANRFNHIRDLSVFFGWCADEKMIAENPFADIKRPHVDRKEPAVLTVEQTKKMLENTDGQDRAYAAIGMFAGVRPEEIMKMNWTMVDLMNGSIRLPGSICKTRVGRSIDLEPNAISWLRTVYAKKGAIFTGDASCLTRRLKLAAGLETWPQDVLRHTYASMHVCHFRNASKTALALHDRRAPDILFRFYFRDQLQDDAKKFWSMMPGK